jgi:predicted nucleic acid-binding protein
MADERTFVDTNVLLYAYDVGAGDKRGRAAELIRGLWRSRTGVLSTQVLQEFYVNATRKLPAPLDRQAAANVLRTYAAWPVHGVTHADVLEAVRVEGEHHLSFWDALIVVAAARSGARRLATEDLNHDQVIEGVRIENPFR